MSNFQESGKAAWHPSALGAVGAGRPPPIHACAFGLGVPVHGSHHSDGHHAGSACRGLPLSCATATGSPVPIRAVRPWTGATGGFDAQSGHRGGWGCAPPHPAASRSLPDQRSLRGKDRGSADAWHVWREWLSGRNSGTACGRSISSLRRTSCSSTWNGTTIRPAPAPSLPFFP